MSVAMQGWLLFFKLQDGKKAWVKRYFWLKPEKKALDYAEGPNVAQKKRIHLEKCTIRGYNVGKSSLKFQMTLTSPSRGNFHLRDELAERRDRWVYSIQDVIEDGDEFETFVGEYQPEIPEPEPAHVASGSGAGGDDGDDGDEYVGGAAEVGEYLPSDDGKWEDEKPVLAHQPTAAEVAAASPRAGYLMFYKYEDGKKQWVRKHFWVSHKGLDYAASDNVTTGKKRVRLSRGCTVEPIGPPSKYIFAVKTPSKGTFNLRGISGADVNEWIASITAACNGQLDPAARPASHRSAPKPKAPEPEPVAPVAGGSTRSRSRSRSSKGSKGSKSSKSSGGSTSSSDYSTGSESDSD